MASMDILLMASDEAIGISPRSIHGMLWLQTHFENEEWEALADDLVKLPKQDADALYEDAKAAGLALNFLPALSIATN